MRPSIPHRYFDFFQLGMVARDLDAGVETLRRQYGIAEVAVHDLAIQTHEGIALLDAALAFVGRLQLELLVPKGGADAVYRDFLPQDAGAIRPHHFGHLIPDLHAWDTVTEAIEKSGAPTPVAGSAEPGIRYIYIDTLATLGLYTEFILLPEATDIFQTIPRYPAG